MMVYAIQTLENQRYLLSRALESWSKQSEVKHSAAYKRQKKKLKELTKAIEVLNSNK